MIKKQIETDFLSAYKEHNKIKVSTLRMIKSSIKNAEINKGEELTDSDIISILKKELKQRKEAIEAFSNAGRAESAEKEKQEAEIISSYLPEQLSSQDLEKIAKETIDQLGAKNMSDMGKVVGKIIATCGDKVDGRETSEIVRKLLSN